jgi:PBP superfamily domain
VHVAGTHLRGPGSDYNITPAAGLLPDGGEVIGFCSWREGLLLRPELADQASGVKDVAGSGLRLVNREPGAEARSLLDRTLADAGIDGSKLPGYHTRAAGHLDVAAAIAAGLADAGIASERRTDRHAATATITTATIKCAQDVLKRTAWAGSRAPRGHAPSPHHAVRGQIHLRSRAATQCVER